MDDMHTGSPSSPGDDDVALSDNVKGFDFGVLSERKPHLKPELVTLRDHLLSADEEETVKVWGWKC